MDKKILILLMLLTLTSIAFALDTSVTLVDKDIYDGRINMFLSSHDNMLAFLIPAIMLFVCLVSFATDFGTVGVSSVSAFALFLLWIIGIVYINWISLLTFIIMVVILTIKISKK